LAQILSPKNDRSHSPTCCEAQRCTTSPQARIARRVHPNIYKHELYKRADAQVGCFQRMRPPHVRVRASNRPRISGLTSSMRRKSLRLFIHEARTPQTETTLPRHVSEHLYLDLDHADPYVPNVVCHPEAFLSTPVGMKTRRSIIIRVPMSPTVIGIGPRDRMQKSLIYIRFIIHE
jgi:hypothetical protein